MEAWTFLVTFSDSLCVGPMFLSQKGNIIPTARSGFVPGFPFSKTCLEQLQGESARRYFIDMPEPPQLLWATKQIQVDPNRAESSPWKNVIMCHCMVKHYLYHGQPIPCKEVQQMPTTPVQIRSIHRLLFNAESKQQNLPSLNPKLQRPSQPLEKTQTLGGSIYPLQYFPLGKI